MRFRYFLFVVFVFPISGVLFSSAWAGSLFGPETYVRGPGKPETHTEKFSQCEPQAKYELTLQNGRLDGSHRLSSVTIMLNGEEILSPNDLNQDVAGLTRPLAVSRDNELQIRLASAPDGELTVSVRCIEGCFGLTIDSPVSGSVLNQRDVLIRGRVQTGSDEAGVYSGFSPGFVAGPPFSYAVPEVPLDLGPNTLEVTATNSCGMTASEAVQITMTEPEDPFVILSANPPAGAAPLDVLLSTLAVPPNPVAGYTWNITDETEPELSFTYDTPGLYFPEVTVTDTEGTAYTATAFVYVLESNQLDAKLKAKWGQMREAMGEGNIEAILNYFSHGSRDKYRQIFEAIEGSLSAEAAGLEDLELITFRGTTAKYRIHRTVTVDGAPRVLTYYVYFIQDGDGIWRIKQF